MTNKNYWQIDGYNAQFARLKDAKKHIEIAFTPQERAKENGTNICHIINGEVLTAVEIRTDNNGKLSFSKPFGVNWWDK